MLDIRGRDSHGQSDVDQGLRDFLRELREHPPDVHDDCDPVVNRFGSFGMGNSGHLTVWQIRCRKRRGPESPWSFANDYLLTMITQRDVLVRIYLSALDLEDMLPRLDSLKELARSVRITDASIALPDIVQIDVDRLSDEMIRQQLLRLTPRGIPMEEVHELVQARLIKGTLDWRLVSKAVEEVHQANGDLYMEIGSYPNPSPASEPSVSKTFPSSMVVTAFWRSDKQQKLRDVEIRRRVIEYKAKSAIPVR